MTADQKPGESGLERFERMAEEFRRSTGMMAPGKDVAVMNTASESFKERQSAWNYWCQGYARAERNAGDAACKHDDGAMMWNPYNAVVQCHQCGTVDWPATHIHWLILLKNIREWGVSSRGYDAQKAVRFAKDIDQIIAPTTDARREGP